MQVEFSLDLKSGNAAFADDPRGETVRLLRAAADRIESGSDCGALHDYNGNAAGHFSLTIEGESDE
ncbi:hypothetical protein DSS3P1_07 [Ruegeria phage DSS3-P1]|uniref:hypothetical protein n=1 Tax=Ruegeria phage DSS3-P1 TaxID=1555208 RepID=UPI0002357D8E|nr:hypothetical protein DSS3P1_07 [Ruegeria phage DSS3-P1]YP_009997142.1 hypothetical protein JT311_gp08 [Ruegeria phage vB_RpoS-V16]YP_009997223.1 hypothetical protein JT312_gp06 [Ruegeria phage vB_RpoS-V18]YP_009997305.1 hypothetical protein JT313_gp06 [Ruegeria phage vB_RpoS-V11]YP_009997388.1 hypothetical protein JT314_gp07 [Ruegeria phage vB_RpoS-V7]AET42330.1 hypothetical protein SDSG_00065 [Ruegeria phage DSS3-P1]AIT13242.1 hypothetical protein DSS3P1_07 [Ruegeria phage DSS3-P1]AWY087